MSAPILLLTNLQRPVFLLNSYSPQFNVNLKRFPLASHPLSQSYRTNLPSSFNKIISSALVYSTRLPVSVYSTVYNFLKLFLEEFNRQNFTYFTNSYSCHFKKIPIILILSNFYLGAVFKLNEADYQNFRNLRLTAIKFYTLFIVTHTSICTSDIFNKHYCLSS